MITFNRLVNIIVFYVLTQQWKFDSIDYLKEKYFRIFNTYPDIIYDNDEFNIELSTYKDLWKLSDISENDIKILNFCHNISKFKKSIGLKPNDFINIHNSFFNSYNSIIDKNQMILLHDKLKEVVNTYIDDYEIFKFLFIRQKLTLNKK